ncbi:hypothetical protein QYM36_005309 [Artemia franciscana]|uniref:Uncharacterized protein n=1 Tax=Artemia franciscana TaxID=6661 RepID=A0AA88I7K5_ARTSF|nr:hypothetical protein QYM36_005309 [Artemia franciscana]
MGNISGKNLDADLDLVHDKRETTPQPQYDSSYFTDDFESLDSSIDFVQKESGDGSLIGQISTAGSFTPCQAFQSDMRRRTQMFLSFRKPANPKHSRRNSWDFNLLQKSGSSLSLVQSNLKRITSKISIGLGIFDDDILNCEDEIIQPKSDLRRAKSMRCTSGDSERQQKISKGHKRQHSISLPRGCEFSSSIESVLFKEENKSGPVSPRISQLKREGRQHFHKELKEREKPNQVFLERPKEVFMCIPMKSAPSYVEVRQSGRWRLRLTQGNTFLFLFNIPQPFQNYSLNRVTENM